MPITAVALAKTSLNLLASTVFERMRMHAAHNAARERMESAILASVRMPDDGELESYG
jgi:hypothetical protein